MKKALFWHYRFADMKVSWAKQAQWLAKALQDEGYLILKTKKFKCNTFDALIYDYKVDKELDIVIYNHTDISRLIGNIAKSKRNWFFKPTVPDKYHTTLDELGYGPFSSITYTKPDYENCKKKDVDKFFDTKVKDWILNRSIKFHEEQMKEIEITDNGYYLVLGQCGGDEVVTRHDFGNYWQKLESIIKELSMVGDKNIIVKLHPHTDGTAAKDDNFSKSLAYKLAKIPKVKVYIGKVNVHNFIEKASCVLLANSGAGFEAMMHGKPIIAWGCPEYRHIAYDLRHLCDLKRALTLDWFDKDLSDKFLFWYMELYCFYNLETAKRRVKEMLSED